MDNIKLYEKDIEKNVLGILITVEDCSRYIKKLETKDFAIGKYQKIFGIIKNLDKNKMPVDIINIKEKIKSLGEDENKALEQLIKITDTYITSTNIEYYIKKLKNYSIRREIIRKAKNMQDYVYTVNSDTDPLEIKKECIKKVTDIETTMLSIEEDEMSSVIAQTIEEIEKRYNKKGDNKYKTGFFELDKITDGLHEQEFTVIAARPGVGKTSIALNIAEHLAEKGIYTYFINLEMSKKQLGNRLISSKAVIDSHRLRSGWLEDNDFERIAVVAQELETLNMLMDTKSTTIQEIESKAVELKAVKNIGLIVIDYLQLLKNKDKFSIREQEVADISRRLKLLSRDLDIPIIALCQLNRETEKRKRPILADLRESGSLEQDADNVIFLYADEKEKQKQSMMDVNVIVAKQRNGPTGEIKLRYLRKTMTFDNKN